MKAPAAYVHDHLPLSQSSLWNLLHDYYFQRGLDAWREGFTPWYVTSNAFIGRSYAELLVDIYDRRSEPEPLRILEPGAGHGQLSYHILRHLERRLGPEASVKYVISDLSPKNVAYCRSHPRLQAFIERGWLDFSVWDALDGSPVQLELGEEIWGNTVLEGDFVTIGNYFFDGLPMDLWRINNGTWSEGKVALRETGNLQSHDPEGYMRALEPDWRFEEREMEEWPGSVRGLASMLPDSGESHLLIPKAAIALLERLRRFSTRGLHLIIGDKGISQTRYLTGRPLPAPDLHGTFSFPLNFPALQAYARSISGDLNLPGLQHYDLVVAFGHLPAPGTVPDPEHHDFLRRSYQRHIDDFGPDDYFRTKQLIQPRASGLDLSSLLAAIRLSRYDTRFFLQLNTRLQMLAPTLSVYERNELLPILQRIWEEHYTFNPDLDLAFTLASLHMQLRAFPGAAKFYQLSIELHGTSVEKLQNLAISQLQQDNPDQARRSLQIAQAIDPADPLTKDLLGSIPN